VIQCQICQVANEDAAQFCRECGGRLNPGQPLATTTANPPAESMPQAQTAPAKPRPKLHSPILGSSGPEPEPQPEESGRKGRSSSQSQSSSRKGLRSPLLGGGGGDDMETEDEAEPRGSKSSLRSPMLGGGGHGGSSGGGSKTAFPHRGDFEPEDSRPTARLESGKHSSKGLRSPLLGGSDFDPEESFDDPGIQAKASGQVKAHHRLRSPILGGSEPDYYEDEVFDEEVEEIEDPNVLRSPLLAVRTPRNQSQSSSHAQPASSAQPMPGQTTGQPAISPQAPAQPPAQAPAAPLNAGQAAQPQPLPPLPYQNPPTQATAAKHPSYQPQPAPLPSNSQYNLSAQKYEYGVNAAAAEPVQVEPALSASAPVSSPIPTSLSSSSTAGTTPTGLSPAPAQLQSNQTVSAKSDSDEVVGPKDRRSPARERRQSRLVSGSSTSGNTSNNYDLDEDDDFSKRSYGTGRSSMNSSNGSGSNPMAPLLMASAAIALTAKGYVLSQQLGYPDFIAKNMPYVADQLATGFVFICLIIFAMKASQKN
jgi:hypothetical protein